MILYSLLLIYWWPQLVYMYMNFGSNRSILSELASGIHFYNGHLYQLSPKTNTYKNHLGYLLWDENLIHSLWCSCVACNDVLYLTFYYENRFYSESWCPEMSDIFCNEALFGVLFDGHPNKLSVTMDSYHKGPVMWNFHYDDVIMTTLTSQITSLAVVYSIVYSGVNQRKHQSSASLAFVPGIHRDRWIPRTKGQ